MRTARMRGRSSSRCLWNKCRVNTTPQSAACQAMSPMHAWHGSTRTIKFDSFDKIELIGPKRVYGRRIIHIIDRPQRAIRASCMVPSKLHAPSNPSHFGRIASGHDTVTRPQLTSRRRRLAYAARSPESHRRGHDDLWPRVEYGRRTLRKSADAARCWGRRGNCMQCKCIPASWLVKSVSGKDADRGPGFDQMCHRHAANTRGAPRRGCDVSDFAGWRHLHRDSPFIIKNEACRTDIRLNAFHLLVQERRTSRC